MKTLTQTLRISVAAAAIFAIPHIAFAAVKTFKSVTLTPNSAFVVQGAAATNTANVAVDNGSGAGARFSGPAEIRTFVSPATATITPVVTGTNFVFPSTEVTYNYTLTVTNTAATPSGTYSIGVVADTNNPPSVNVTPVTNFFTLNIGFNPVTIWTPAGVNSNWSTAANWSAAAAPVSSNDVYFIDNTGAPSTPGTVDNIVDTSLLVGSLTYGGTNSPHTTFINSGVTLTIGGDTMGLVVGTGTHGQDSSIPTDTITNGAAGSGGLVVSNSAANVLISQSYPANQPAVSAAQATLDLSGLNNFTAIVSRFLVGCDINLSGASGVLNLAKTNNITVATGSTAPQLVVGDNSENVAPSPAVSSTLLLGQTNAIFADSISVGRGKGPASFPGSEIMFNPNFANATAYFRGTNGPSSAVGTWSIGDGGVDRTWQANGTCDFSLGTVNVLVNTMYIGIGSTTSQTEATPGLGVLTFAAGTINATNLFIGDTIALSTGTLNANGGSLVVNANLTMAFAGGTSGTLSISNGTVTANSGITVGAGSANIAMAGGSLLATNSSATIGTMANPLNSFSVSNSALTVAVQRYTPAVATANLVANGTVNTINVSAVTALSGFPSQFPVIQYGLNGGSASGNLGTFVVGTLPTASPAFGAYISNNVANSSIDIVFTNGPTLVSLTWDGATNGNWDTTTANWRQSSGPDTTYANGNAVTFDDSLTGTSNVIVTASFTPAILVFNNSVVPYTFTGAGSLSGGVTLGKLGAGTVMLSETGGDNFTGGIVVTNGTLILDDPNGAITGGTTISGGMLQIGNNDVSGSVPAGNIADNGTLTFDCANNIVVTNPITGTGTLTQGDTNIVTLTGNNSVFTGTAVAAQGSLQIGNSNAVFAAASSITVSNGATLDTDGQLLYNGTSGLTVTVGGTGVGGNGAIVNNSTNTTTLTLHIVTLTADTTFGGVSGWDIRNSSGNSAGPDGQLNGAFNLTKVSSNTVTLRSLTIDPGLGNISVRGGGLHFTATGSAPISSLGNASATVTVFSNSTFTLDTIGLVPAKNFVLTNGGTLSCSATNYFGDPLTLLGAANNTISVGTGSQFFITNPITGSGGFSKNGSGQLYLGASNTYTGNTIISGGTLALYANGSNASISASVLINITGGALLDVSGRSDDTFTLASGQTLEGGAGTNGPGSINGILVASAGSTIAPGTGSTTLGTIAVSGNATLQGATTMKLNASTGTNDQLLANGITYGGSLLVTNAVGTITNSQTFKLFTASNGVYNAATFSSISLPAPPGVTWATNLTVNGTITATVVAVSPVITGISISGTTLTIMATNGAGNGMFTLFGSTNLSPPITWTPIWTNQFNGFGNLNQSTNILTLGTPAEFFLLEEP